MANSTSPNKTTCGFVSVIGLPNAGKSTLINRIVGEKVSIVSRKVQTTRNRILGIAMHKNSQIILMDTPGIFKPSAKTLERAMVSAAWDTVEEADIIIHLLDVVKKNAIRDARLIMERLAEQKAERPNLRVLLVLNKIDTAKKELLLTMTQTLNEAFDYEATFMISGLKGSGVEHVMDYLAEQLPKSPYMYPEDQVSDMPLRFLASEITREKIYDQLHEELPYAAMVQTEDWEEFDNGDIKIRQVIYIKSDSQKAIVLGKQGSRIKQIGERARFDLEKMLDCKVHINLFVKVQENWADRAENYSSMGLNFPVK